MPGGRAAGLPVEGLHAGWTLPIGGPQQDQLREPQAAVCACCGTPSSPAVRPVGMFRSSRTEAGRPSGPADRRPFSDTRDRRPLRRRFDGRPRRVRGELPRAGRTRGRGLGHVDGRAVVDLWGGWADPARSRPWERDTLVNVWSTTKGPTALCAHLLADRGCSIWTRRSPRTGPSSRRQARRASSYATCSRTARASRDCASRTRSRALRLGADLRPAGRHRAVVGARHRLRLPRHHLRLPGRRGRGRVTGLMPGRLPAAGDRRAARHRFHHRTAAEGDRARRRARASAGRGEE